MDPPWNETGGGRIKRGADRHYPLVKTPDLPRVILSAPVWRPAGNCHLYMWATASHLPDALWLMGALGFKYKTHAVWVKDRAGLGQYFRMRHELLLLGVRGRGFATKTDSRSIQSVLVAPRGAHSAKPWESIQMITARSTGPYLEMFAREPRAGWTVWGNEVGKTEE